MTSVKETLVNSLRDHTARIGILGLGYVGLPLAAAFGEAGFQIIGIDPDPRKVNSINKGESYIQDVPSEQISQAGQSGQVIRHDRFFCPAPV